MTKSVIILGVVAVLVIGGLAYFRLGKTTDNANSRAGAVGLRYVAVGDSYSIGQGALESESWPSLLANDLNQHGVKISLVANLGRVAYTTQNAIDRELGVFEQEKPDFGTLMIGVNDLVQGVDEATFRANLVMLVSRMAVALPRQDRLLLVTIPDFSVTPAGQNLAHGKADELAASIAAFNAIIKAEADARGMKVVDIFELSQQVKEDASLVAGDGLHPSAKQYLAWEQLIYPVAKEILH